MILFNVNGKQYKLIESWSEMTIEKASTINEVIEKEMPVALNDYYKLLSIRDDNDREKELDEWFKVVDDKALVKTFPDFYGKLIALFTDIPSELVQNIYHNERTTFFKTYIEKFVIGLIYGPIDYIDSRRISFEFNGIEYFLPITKNILGADRPFHDRKAIEFTEAADLELFSKDMAGGKLAVAANIISILCRPHVNKEVEPYNEEVCLKRAEEFKQLGMDICFDVFFCLNEHIITSRQTSLILRLNQLLKDQTKEMVLIRE